MNVACVSTRREQHKRALVVVLYEINQSLPEVFGFLFVFFLLSLSLTFLLSSSFLLLFSLGFSRFSRLVVCC